MSVQLCKNCGKPMKQWVHYDRKRNYKYSECPNCHYRSKEQKIFYKKSESNILSQGGMIEW